MITIDGLAVRLKLMEAAWAAQQEAPANLIVDLAKRVQQLEVACTAVHELYVVSKELREEYQLELIRQGNLITELSTAVDQLIKVDDTLESAVDTLLTALECDLESNSVLTYKADTLRRTMEQLDKQKRVYKAVGDEHG